MNRALSVFAYLTVEETGDGTTSETGVLRSRAPRADDRPEKFPDPGPVGLTANRSSCIFSFEEKGL